MRENIRDSSDRDSNPEPSDYMSATLPIELPGLYQISILLILY